MDRKKINLFSAVIVLALSAMACNFPGTSAPTPFEFPTPVYTPTTIINPNVFPTATAPGAGEVTSTGTAPGLPTQPANPTANLPATVVPTNTAVPPTATAVPPTATRTPVPPVSFEGPGARPGARITASFLRDKPVIDGEFGDWNLDRLVVEEVVAGARDHEGDDDLSARLMLGWDEENLYVAARVLDDRYVQNAEGEDLFKGDSLEILLDTDVASDFYLEELSGDDFQLGISPGNGEPGEDPEAYLWYPRSESGSRSRVKIGAIGVEEGYRVEAAIPWSTFDVSPRQGRHFGFAFSVSDNDRPKEEVQQSMVSTARNRVLTDPTTWGDLELSGSGPRPEPTQAVRTGTSVNAEFLEAAPTLDGNLGEWDLDMNSISSVTYGADHWSNPQDLSGRFMAGWDEDFLYLGVQVFDNRYVQNASGEELFLGDSLEILFDADLAGDFNQKSLSGDDYQLGISPGEVSPAEEDEAYLWYPRSKAGKKDQVEAASTATEDGYIVEAAIPWGVLGGVPAAGRHFGFVISISDNDNEARGIQQSLVSNVPGRVLTDPTTWGDFVLAQQ